MDERVPVSVEFTNEELDRIRQWFDLFHPSNENDGSASDGDWYIQPKAKDGLTAHALREYVHDLLSQRDCAEDSAARIRYNYLASRAQAKVCVIGGLPIYMFEFACMLQKAGDIDRAREAFSNFLVQQSKFVPDAIDQMFLDQLPYDMDIVIETAIAGTLL